MDFTLDIRMLYAMPSHIATLGKFFHLFVTKRKISFYLSGIALLLMVSSVVHQYYGLNLEDKCENPAFKLITPVSYEAAIVLVQNLVLMPFLVSYMSIFVTFINYFFPNVILCILVRVTRFNKVQPPPDVQREEWLASVIDDSLFKKGDVGFR